MPKRAEFHQAFEGRLAGLEGLIAAREPRFSDSDRLRRDADAIDLIAPSYERTATGIAYTAFAELLRLGALLVQWRAAVLTGEAGADRFLLAAKERYRIWQSESATIEGATPALAAAKPVGDLEQVSEIGKLLSAFAGLPLPIGIYAREGGGIALRRPHTDDADVSPPDLTVAFLLFAIDGQPAAETQFLTPGETHDLELEVRISRWPDQADTLELRPLSIEAAASYDFPTFNFERPATGAALVLRQRGRAMIRAPQGLNARPFEFRYAASFNPPAVEQPVAVMGQRTLRIESIDLKVNSLTGYPALDAKIIQIRDQLRSHFNVSPDDLGPALTLTTALGAYMSRVLQDNEIPEVLSERAFQTIVRAELRRRPEIGAALTEHPAAAGGLTDFTLHGVPLELKVEPRRRLTLADCQSHVGQTTSYAVGNGKRVGVLCVLDCSLKTRAAMPAESCLGLLTDSASESTPIITLLVQGNLAMPSSLSR